MKKGSSDSLVNLGYASLSSSADRIEEGGSQLLDIAGGAILSLPLMHVIQAGRETNSSLAWSRFCLHHQLMSYTRLPTAGEFPVGMTQATSVYTVNVVQRIQSPISWTYRAERPIDGWR
jgi:hypothetical protein